MKLVVSNMIFAASLLFFVDVQAQTLDTLKNNSAREALIELENSKNLIPTSKNNPPAYIQNNHKIKASEKPKKSGLKLRKKKSP